MKQTFDYLENIPNIAATVCDKDGIVLYQNKRAIDRDGDVIGKNLFGCHSKKSAEMIKRMLECAASNTYQVIHHGKQSFIHQTPWFDEDGTLGGLIELEVDLPENMRIINRDL